MSGRARTRNCNRRCGRCECERRRGIRFRSHPRDRAQPRGLGSGRAARPLAAFRGELRRTRRQDARLIAGLGRSGTRVAKLGRAFNMTVLGTRRTPGLPEDIEAHGVERVEPDELFARSHYLVLLLTPLASGRPFIDEAALAAMRGDAILVNAGPRLARRRGRALTRARCRCAARRRARHAGKRTAAAGRRADRASACVQHAAYCRAYDGSASARNGDRGAGDRDGAWARGGSLSGQCSPAHFQSISPSRRAATVMTTPATSNASPIRKTAPCGRSSCPVRVMLASRGERVERYEPAMAKVTVSLTVIGSSSGA